MNMSRKIFLLSVLIFICFSGWAQTAIKGRVIDKNTQKAIAGAMVHFLGSKQYTITDEQGVFELSSPRVYSHFVVRFVGLGSDTIAIGDKKAFEIELQDRSLETISIESRRETLFVDEQATQKVLIVQESELEKAACCNLSESFETNPSVDISVSDAMIGIRQVQMLGLASVYTQTTQESMPYGIGLLSGLGLSLIPGTWVESMQVSKGVGSVVNGYQAIAGQINFELRKPTESEHFFFNLYANNQSRLEANLHTRHLISPKVSTIFLAHGDMTQSRFDMNRDGFLDMPQSQQINLLNRWQFILPHGWESQIGAKHIGDGKLSGHADYTRSDRYRVEMRTLYHEIWAKIGKKFASKPYKSLAGQYSYRHSELQNQFGLYNYYGNQNTWYFNAIYQSIIGTTTHKFRTGAGFISDHYHEQLDSMFFSRLETVGGAFFEYSYLPDENFSLVAGFRSDYHSLFGAMMTPRLHMRYSPKAGTTLRIAAGKGYRTANFLAENQAVLMSSRRLFLPEASGYPFRQEQAWNIGGNVLQEWELFGRQGTISGEYYYTFFSRQVVADLDKSATEVHISDLRGNSYSHSLQADLTYELLTRLDLRLSYRYLDVQMPLAGRVQQRPLVARHRAFVNLAYAVKSWKIDATLNWIGKKRLPANLGGEGFGTYSPGFLLLHGQISKAWLGGQLDTYLGTENALDVRQKALIVQPERPWTAGFDGSLAWGPAMGRMVYLGLRYRMK